MPGLTTSRYSLNNHVDVSYQDSARFPRQAFALHPDGMCLKTRWQFDTGIELQVCFQIPNEKNSKLTINGVVVSCFKDKKESRAYNVTVYFIDINQTTRRKIMNVSNYFNSSARYFGNNTFNLREARKV